MPQLYLNASPSRVMETICRGHSRIACLLFLGSKEQLIERTRHEGLEVLSNDWSDRVEFGFVSNLNELYQILVARQEAKLDSDCTSDSEHNVVSQGQPAEQPESHRPDHLETHSSGQPSSGAKQLVGTDSITVAGSTDLSKTTDQTTEKTMEYTQRTTILYGLVDYLKSHTILTAHLLNSTLTKLLTIDRHLSCCDNQALDQFIPVLEPISSTSSCTLSTSLKTVLEYWFDIQDLSA